MRQRSQLPPRVEKPRAAVNTGCTRKPPAYLDLMFLDNPHKVAFAKNANALTLGDQLFGFAVLCALFMTGEPAQILIALN